jgi:hypothetical protein
VDWHDRDRSADVRLVFVNARVGHDASSRFPNAKLDARSRDDPDSRIDPAILTLGAV